MWSQIFEAGASERPEGATELWPYWVYTGPRDESNSPTLRDPALIERHVMAMPLSKDQIKFENLKRSLVLYRSVLGQPRQQDLIEIIERHVPKDEQAEYAELLKINLSPRERPRGASDDLGYQEPTRS